MSQQDAFVTAHPATSITPQNQEGSPDLNAATKQKAEWSRLEFWNDNGKPYLREYESRNLFSGKAALITEGDSGVGRAMAISFAREGADVSIVYLPECEEAGQKANLMAANLKEREECERVVEDYVKVFGNLNVLVNNGIDLDITEKIFHTIVISDNPTLSDFASTKGAIATFTHGLAQQQAKN
ncbi:hypothetical protein DE146DRAFT_743473 [Phaeosphaeria sp. MPI-PUGE-AT-0046c]|nr:hypothetical protein DE146DRAFT_743473 [Phaeosphaeria sp. MPI-PUGE-AT-0046c]